MTSGPYRWWEILALGVVCIISVIKGVYPTPKEGEFEFVFKDVKHKATIDHQISSKDHMIIIRGNNNTVKGKVISLPHPLKGDWKKHVKLGNMDGKGHIKWDKKGRGKWGGKGKGKNKWKKNKGKGKKGYKNHKNRKSGRIVGGNVVDPPHSFPWQVAFVPKSNRNFASCGATILCPRYIMIAAHCVENAPVPKYRVNQNKGGIKTDKRKWLIVAGAHNIRDTSEPTRTEHRIKRIKIHPKRTTWTWDYAVLELENSIELRREARPLFLPQHSDHRKLSPSTMLVVSGWGDLYTNAHQGTAKLMFAKVPFVSDSQCMDIYEASLVSGQESVFCAGYVENGGIDACQGDSGGPLAFLDGNKVKLIGVVSTGTDCAQAGLPGLYAKMTVGLDWVKEMTGHCNERTCRRGACMTREDLGPAQRYFMSWKKN